MEREGRECGVGGGGDCDVIYVGCLCKALLRRWLLCRDLMDVETQEMWVQSLGREDPLE